MISSSDITSNKFTLFYCRLSLPFPVKQVSYKLFLLYTIFYSQDYFYYIYFRKTSPIIKFSIQNLTSTNKYCWLHRMTVNHWQIRSFIIELQFNFTSLRIFVTYLIFRVTGRYKCSVLLDLAAAAVVVVVCTIIYNLNLSLVSRYRYIEI
jgi:hypothetical protein